jgi:hypothetical protein
MRGGVCGIMTTLGGIGHTMPFLYRISISPSGLLLQCSPSS